MSERVSTAPAGADPAVILATNILALNRPEFGAAKWYEISPTEVELLCRWIAARSVSQSSATKRKSWLERLRERFQR